MSTGQKQRVKLAQAIADDPALALLDEPTDGLDPVQRDDMLTLDPPSRLRVRHRHRLVIPPARGGRAGVRLGDHPVGGRVVAYGTIAELTGVGRGVLVEVDGDTGVVAVGNSAARRCSRTANG